MQLSQAFNPRRIARSLVTVLVVTLLQSIVPVVVAPVITTPKAKAVDVPYANATTGTDVVVPAGVFSITFTARGAAGGSGGADASAGTSGTNVGYASGTFAVTPGDRISLYPGGAGGNGASSASNSGGGTAGAPSLTNYAGRAASFKFNGTYSDIALLGGGTGGNAGAGGSSGSGGGGGAASMVAINDNVALVAAGGGGGAGGSGPGAQSWNGTYVAHTASRGADGIYGGGCGNTDGGGTGAGGGGWQGGAAGVLDRPGGTGECRAWAGSPGANFVWTSGTSTSSSYTTANGAGFISYVFNYSTTTACPTTSDVVDIYTVVKVTTLASCTWSVPANVSTVDLFLVGGGGGGAGDAGPGGNGGFATSRSAIAVAPNSTMTLKVGYGGAGSNWGWGQAYSGDVTTVQTSTGATYSALGGATGLNDPSGAAATPTTAPNGSFAGGMGGNGPGCFNVGGAGKRGISNYFYGTLNTYSGGGGAGSCPNGSATTPAASVDGGGQGGYASSSSVNQPGTNGADNRGGGGGGGTATGTGMKLPGGKGGSGVILIRYATDAANAFPTSLASSVSARWSAGDMQVLDSAREGWMDSFGTNATIPTGNFTGAPSITTRATIDSGSPTRSSKALLTVTGTTTDNITLANLPSNYTMFNIARYRTTGSKGRLITTNGGNWLSGFHGGRAGLTHHNWWLTPEATNVPSAVGWVLSTDQVKLYRADGLDVSYVDNGAQNNQSTSTGFGINNSNYNEKSDFDVADILVFNRQLNNGEIRAMEIYLARVYGLTLNSSATSAETDTAATLDTSMQLIGPSGYGGVLNDTFTIQAWVNPATYCATGLCQFVAKEGTVLFGMHAGTLRFALWGKTVGGWSWTDTLVKVPSNEWHHVAMVKQFAGDAGGSLLFYLDGRLVHTVTGSPYASGTYYNSTSSSYAVNDNDDNYIYVGGRSIADQRLVGQIDEVKIWRAARTVTQIQSDMHSNETTTAALQYYWDFNRAVGSSTVRIPNLATNGVPRGDLSISGTPTYADVKVTTTVGPYTTLTFPRTYINQFGGWRVPDSVTTTSILVVGGGGGGGGAFTGDLAGGAGGGGGGGVFAPATPINLTNNRIVPVVVGAGGVGGPASATREGGAGTPGQTSYFANLSAGGGGGGGNVSSANVNGLSGTSGGGGGGASNYYNAYNAGTGGLSQITTFAGETYEGFSGGNGAVYVAGSSATGDAGAGGGASTSATRTAIGGGISSPLSGTSTAYGRGGGARGVTGWSFAAVPANLGTGGSGQYNSSAPGGNGSSGVVIVRWITALKPTFTPPTNALLNVGMTETFTTNVAQDSATVMLTRNFRWESTTAGANGTFTTIKQGTGAGNAAFSWVPTDTSTSGSQYLYRVVVTDSDSYGLFIVDTSTPVFAVINRTLAMTGPTSIKKQINVARNETFTISHGTPSYRFTLTPTIPGITLDTSTVGTTLLRISDTASAGTYLETLTVTDSVSASVTIPLSITISAPPSLVNSGEIVDTGLEFNIDMANTASYSRATGTISDISGTKKVVTINGGSTFNEDFSGNLKLSNTQHISATGFRTLSSFTIEAYINLRSIGSDQVCVFGSEQNPTNVPYFLCIDSGRTVFTGFYNGQWTYKRTTQTLTLGSWTHLVGVFDSTTSGTKMELYINGAVTTLSDSAQNAGLIPPSASSDKIFINKWFYTTSSPTSAMDIGLVRLYRVPLSFAQVQQNYNATKDRFATANINQIKPTQKYGTITLESFTVTSGGDTETVSFAVGNRAGIAWDTTSTPGQIRLTVHETLTPGIYFDTITVTDNFAQSTNLPIRFTVTKADTITIFIDTPTALNYSGSQALFTATTRTIGAVGLESGTAISTTLRFKPAGTTCATGGYCRVGDIGPGGGIVFIDTSTASSDGRIYEVAPQNWSGSDDLSTVGTFCSNNSSTIGSTQIGIGWGETNTNLAKTACLGGAVGRVNTFNSSNTTGYSDWFIPSRNEGIELAKVAATAGLLNIGSNWSTGNWGYWGSTEVNSSTMSAIGHVGPLFNGTSNVLKSEATKNMVRPVRAFRPCWAIDTCTALLTTETPTAAGIYVISPTSGASAAKLADRYSSVRYIESRMTINRIAQRPQVIPFINVNFPDTFTVNVIEGNGNGAVTYSATNGTASGCAFDYKKLYSITQGTCTVTVVKAGDRNYLPDTTTAGMLLLEFVLNQPSPGVGSGPNIALSGQTSVTLDPNVAPTISSLSTYTAQAGVTTLVITGAGFDSTNLAGITVKFWRNIVASGFTVNAQNSQITVTVPAGATTGKVIVTTPNGQAVSEFALTITP